MDPRKILLMDTGPLMDELITSIVRQIDADMEHKAWSTDRLAALDLREFICGTGCSVSITKHAGSPRDLEEFCLIQDEEDENMNVSTTSADVAESISRAFLLYHYKFYGDHMNAKFAKAMREAKRRQAKVYHLPLNKD